MKLIRHGAAGRERPGLQLADGSRVDASAFGEDYGEEFFATGGVRRLAEWFEKNESKLKPIPADARLGPPIPRPSKIVCIGLNYSAHAAETNAQAPAEPVVFMKATSALCGPNDDLILPRDGAKVDWEVELAIVIGRRARYVASGDALAHVAGYCLMCDYSERAFQLEHGGQWVKGKSCDTFAPLGPFLATPDEIADVNALNLWLNVNGERRQNGNTADLIFDVPFLICYLSRFMSLLPGDVISTGTPAGVGLGMKPPQFLKAGDVVELGVDGLGSSRQHVKAYPG